ncbi:MAG: PDZ domain-containing protein [Sulfuriferula multivorans]|uniref:PDZ domain-containing protein n=1 Tax=Sulfuriferula multivorans TaxID=1559896 RepID=A0A7C9P5L7_9PROT|nr:PDZ domain-containing protein [Sulfuriferula multivorans]
MHASTRTWTIRILAATVLFALGGVTHAWLTPPPHAGLPTTPVAAGAPAPVPAGLPDFTPLVRQNAAAVVNISVTSMGQSGVALNGVPDPLQRFFQPLPETDREQTGVGSGFVIESDGYILTNAHVVDGAREINVKFSDKRERSARVIGVDPLSDIALIKVDAKDLPTVQIGRAGTLRVGQWVLAIGSPFGFEQSASQGIVSALGRSLPGDAYVPFVQTDVPINPGNSGGPLIDLAGRVVGVNAQIYSRSGGYQGVSFAIPVDVAMQVAAQLKANGKVTRGWLGIEIQEVNQELAASFKLDQPTGALVASVAPHRPAAVAGIRPGDVIRSYDGKTIVKAGDLPPRVAVTPPGHDAALEVWRNSHLLGVDVTIARLPEQTARRG